MTGVRQKIDMFNDLAKDQRDAVDTKISSSSQEILSDQIYEKLPEEHDD